MEPYKFKDSKSKYCERNKPQNYEEWLVTGGVPSSLGLKYLVTYKILQRADKVMFDSLFNLVRDAFNRSLFEKGITPISIEFNKEDDPSMRTRELTAIIEAQQGASLQEYAGVIFAHARDFYYQIDQWENKSLWQYFKYWVKRKWGLSHP